MRFGTDSATTYILCTRESGRARFKHGSQSRVIFLAPGRSDRNDWGAVDSGPGPEAFKALQSSNVWIIMETVSEVQPGGCP
jgi:hypothetical protein